MPCAMSQETASRSLDVSERYRGWSPLKCDPCRSAAPHKHGKMAPESGGLPMERNPRELLQMLKFELNFLENGGYERSVREPRKELSVFQDSISCLNYALPAKEHPCSECHL